MYFRFDRKSLIKTKMVILLNRTRRFSTFLQLFMRIALLRIFLIRNINFKIDIYKLQNNLAVVHFRGCYKQAVVGCRLMAFDWANYSHRVFADFD